MVLIWNTRKTSTSFLRAYEELVSSISDNRRVRHEDINDQALRGFLGDYRAVKLDSSQESDYEGLVGRLLSASYVPLRGEPLFDQVITKVSELFDRLQVGGVVTFEYVTEVYAGQLGSCEWSGGGRRFQEVVLNHDFYIGNLGVSWPKLLKP